MPIVVLALVFNVTNAVGFTYAWVPVFLIRLPIRQSSDILISTRLTGCSDRDAKQKWANNLASSGWNMGMGGLGGQILTGVVKNSVGRVFG